MKSRRWSAAAFELALRALPSALRREFGADMRDLFEDRLRESTNGWQRTRLLFGALTDIALQAIAFRFSRAAGGFFRAGGGSARTPDRPRMSSVRALGADVVFGLRQLRKHRSTSAAAILSLGLAIGSFTAAFRLIDGLILRPLPVEDPASLYSVAYEGTVPNHPRRWDSGSYPMFRSMRGAVEGQADVIAVSPAGRRYITYGSDVDLEQAYVQRVSGNAFDVLGLRPGLGRLLTESDDLVPGAHPYAVLTERYWDARFDRDPGVIDRTFRWGDTVYRVVGVVRGGFTGVEPGVVADLFVPTMMGPAVENVNQNGLRTFLRVKEGANPDQIRDVLARTWLTFQEQRLTASPTTDAAWRMQYLSATRLRVTPAAAGVSDVRDEFGGPLVALGVLAGLVLLIACANVANLLSVRGAARSRELAIRVSLGAERGRLMQLLLVESALIAVLATVVGATLAWWSAPAVVGLVSQDSEPIRLLLPTDWRALGFGMLVALGVTVLFGVAPALRASATEPVRALKGSGPLRQRRFLRALAGGQVAFCFVVVLITGLFVSSLDGLSRVPTGFSAEGVLTLDMRARPAQPPDRWDDVAEQLRAIPGVQSVALAGWPLLDGSSTNARIAIEGSEPDREHLTEFLCVSPGWIEAMRIPLLSGRDLQPEDANPGAALVNETFAQLYFPGGSAVGRSFTRGADGDRLEIAGVVGDVRYLSLRDETRPTAYVPCRAQDDNGSLLARSWGTLIVRTNGSDPVDVASAIRAEMPRAQSGLRIREVRTQQAINDRHTARERLLATLGLFFATVSLLLVGVGQYGVLRFSVLQRRPEIGIRVALGARPIRVARLLAAETLVMLGSGMAIGLLFGIPAARSVQALYFQVDPTSPKMLILPIAVVLAIGTMAMVPGILQVLKLQPARAIRAE
jgi:putative ABC transport system permease protein